MKFLIGALLLIASFHVAAECSNSLQLEGVKSIESCYPSSEKCISAHTVLLEYASKVKGGKDPEVLNIHMHASPWRLYDRDWRIMDIEEVATMVRPHIANGVKRVQLISSWTGVAPDCSSNSLAQKLSSALNGFSVTGMDGFLWLEKDGNTRTTRQKFSTWMSGRPYHVSKNGEVMVSLIAGWPIDYQSHYIETRNAEGVFRAAVGWDVFYLKPQNALSAFEAAAKLNHPIAAYNAAVMRLERNEPGDQDAAVALLSRAAEAGDKKAQAKLEKLKQVGHSNLDKAQ